MNQPLAEKRAARIAAIRAAFVEGARKYFPNVQSVVLSDDSVIDAFQLGILDGPDAEFERFIESLRNPPPPEEVPRG